MVFESFADKSAILNPQYDPVINSGVSPTREDTQHKNENRKTSENDVIPEYPSLVPKKTNDSPF